MNHRNPPRDPNRVGLVGRSGLESAIHSGVSLANWAVVVVDGSSGSSLPRKRQLPLRTGNFGLK